MKLIIPESIKKPNYYFGKITGKKFAIIGFTISLIWSSYILLYNNAVATVISIIILILGVYVYIDYGFKRTKGFYLINYLKNCVYYKFNILILKNNQENLIFEYKPVKVSKNKRNKQDKNTKQSKKKKNKLEKTSLTAEVGENYHE